MWQMQSRERLLTCRDRERQLEIAWNWIIGSTPILRIGHVACGGQPGAALRRAAVFGGPARVSLLGPLSALRGHVSLALGLRIVQMHMVIMAMS